MSKLLKNTKPAQLWRPNGGNPAKWVAVGPKTVAIRGNQLDYRTAGVGSTPAAAVADYERKKGSLGPPGDLLSAAERSLIQWYSAMDASKGPTSVRRAATGKYYGEYWRPSTGSKHHGPLGSMQAALDWLKKQRL